MLVVDLLCPAWENEPRLDELTYKAADTGAYKNEPNQSVASRGNNGSDHGKGDEHEQLPLYGSLPMQSERSEIVSG